MRSKSTAPVNPPVDEVILGSTSACERGEFYDPGGARVSHSLTIRNGQLYNQVALKADQPEQVSGLYPSTWQLFQERTGMRPQDYLREWFRPEEAVTALPCRRIEVSAGGSVRGGCLSASCHYSAREVGSVTRELEVSSSGQVSESLRLQGAPQTDWQALQPALIGARRISEVDVKSYFDTVFADSPVKPGCLVVKARRQPQGREASIDFALLREGQEVGSMVRSFTEGHVHHDYFRLSDENQGAGLAKSILRRSVAFYEKAGIHSVDVFAALEIGGYAWSKYGFTPIDEAEMAQLSRRVGRNLEALDLEPDVKSAVTRLLRENDPKTIWTLADLALPVQLRGKSMKLGQALLLGRTWQGRLDLRDAEARQRFDTYVGKEK